MVEVWIELWRVDMIRWEMCDSMAVFSGLVGIGGAEEEGWWCDVVGKASWKGSSSERRSFG